MKADEYERKELWSKALEYICDRFEAVPIDDILKIDEKNFLEVLKNDQIMAAETVVFNRLTLWVEENKAIGEKVDSNLLKSIRLKHIPAEVSCSDWLLYLKNFSIICELHYTKSKFEFSGPGREN